jgi:LuxR family maltose regulon positive regulatory protein
MRVEPRTDHTRTAPPPRRKGRLHIAEPPRPAAPARSRRPVSRRARIDRPGLVRRLATAHDAPLALLVAPAGYGKTTVLAEWAERDARPFAWIAARPVDDDPNHLVASIIRRLHEIEPLPRDLVRSVTSPRAEPGIDPLDLLLHSLESPRGPVVLVIDDAQVLRAPATMRVVAEIAEQLGTPSMVAIASRTEPALPIGRLRAEDAVIELRADDLAMGLDEAEQVLRRAGLDLGPVQTAALLHDTEGWPAALHLAGLALRDQDDHSAAIAHFAGGDRLVADYLRDELLAPLAPEDLALLTQTATLDRLSGALCDAVLEQHGSAEMLRRLSRAGALLEPMDRGEEHFHLHGLLSGLLRTELRRADPALEVAVHRRASTWYEHEGDADRAIDHAIAAEDVDRAADLLWTIAPARLTQDRERTVERWLHRLGDAQIACRPALALAAATVHAFRGDRDVAEHWTAMAECLIAELPEARRRPLAAAALTLRAAIARDGVQQMGADAAQAYALAAPDSPWRPVACFLEGASRHLTGDVEVARVRLEEGARRGTLGPPNARVLCLAQLALISLLEEDLDEGLLLAESARHEAERAGLSDLPACALVFAVSAFARAHHGLVDAARRDVSDAQRLVAELADLTPWYDAEIRVALARAELRLSDSCAARTLLAEASRALRHMPENPIVREWIDDIWARADTFAAGFVVGPSTLTTAELRVLRFLPSHLSFREIAARLHVSANTVKTQAHAVYRKLDASSRSEAVARARGIGLIDV